MIDSNMKMAGMSLDDVSGGDLCHKYIDIIPNKREKRIYTSKYILYMHRMLTYLNYYVYSFTLIIKL